MEAPDHGLGPRVQNVTKTFRALLELLVAHQASLPEGFEATWQRLQVALLCWSSGTDGLCPSLAARSCEALVHTLRLLDASELPWPSRALCYHGCFLSLAAALRAFSSVCDLLVPGQGVILIGLQTPLGQQLNGTHAVVQHFHAQTGRFAVCLKEGDPPCEWKKIRPQNLQADADPSSASSIALQGARECGRACLESVAEIFDDLLLMIHDEDDDSTSVLHSHLSASMWDALMQCVQDRCLPSSALLDLCSNNATLCSVLARHIFSVPVKLSRPEATATQRVLRLQEGFARAYCKLYQPDALWDASLGGGIAELQVELDGHVLNLAAAAVQFAPEIRFIKISCGQSWGFVGLSTTIKT
ncbi:unnamed protein product [Symbiodinium microadriaticum]|nr:unnamed protein product [Symbiodinium microadriaticum]